MRRSIGNLIDVLKLGGGFIHCGFEPRSAQYFTFFVATKEGMVFHSFGAHPDKTFEEAAREFEDWFFEN
jgi:hypothetical protein